jgi:hypothetical protein
MITTEEGISLAWNLVIRVILRNLLINITYSIHPGTNNLVPKYLPTHVYGWPRISGRWDTKPIRDAVKLVTLQYKQVSVSATYAYA